jgi:ubiquinone/menaquinone biosynthesis C-methylase UbiE
MSVEPRAPTYALQLSEAERMRYREMAKRARAQEGERWEQYGIVPGSRVADIGCGPGAVLVLLAQLVAPGGSVVGVEPNPEARNAAIEEIQATGTDNATVIEGEGTATMLEPESFDAVMIRHVLYHVGADAAAVLEHAASLLRVGGHLYVVDTDFTGTRLSVHDADFAEQAERFVDFHRTRGNNVDIGPRLGALVAATGLELLEHVGFLNAIPGPFLVLGGPIVAARREMLAAGVITEEDARRYDEAAARVASMPHAILFTAYYIAVGRKRETAASAAG